MIKNIKIMKKLIFALILSIAPFTIKAQTLEETMEYIEANVLNYCLEKASMTKCQGTTITTINKYYSSEVNNPPAEIGTINLKDIKSVSYISKPKYISITISGNSYIQNYSLAGDFRGEQEKVSFIELALLTNTPETAVQKIIKAIKHAAKLGGAKLINEDLFKN